MPKKQTLIHKTAIIGKKVQLGKNVQVGPYAIIEGDVIIGDDTVIEAGAHIVNTTTIGKNCKIFQGAVIGQIPQDLKYKGEKTAVIIGDNNSIREYVTVNLATAEKGETTIGNNNLIMAYSHVAHDCTIGNDNVLANVATLAGFVQISNRVVIGGLVAVHQYCRIGDGAIIGGCSKVVQDIPPYAMADGHPALVRGLNLVGLKRAQVCREEIMALKKAFTISFFKGHPISQAIDELHRSKLSSFDSIKKLITFLSSSKRGIAR